MKEYTQKRNLNRGYMRLQVWSEGIELFKFCYKLLNRISNIDFKLKGQILDAAQSISSNIAEGYCRRSILEYLHFLNIALGSAGEVMTRMIGLEEGAVINKSDFEEFDKIHYSLENKLLALVKSLQEKKETGNWDVLIHEPQEPYNPE